MNARMERSAVDVAAHVERAHKLIEWGRYRDALPELQIALSLDPDHYPALCLLAQAHLAIDDFQESLKWADRAIASQPEDEWGYRLRAVALHTLGRKRDALDAAHEASRLAPEVPDVLDILAYSL